MIVVDVLLSLACKRIAEAVALSLHSSDAHYTSHLATIFGTGIGNDIYRLDILGHEIAQFRVIAHLPAINILKSATIIQYTIKGRFMSR